MCLLLGIFPFCYMGLHTRNITYPSAQPWAKCYVKANRDEKAELLLRQRVFKSNWGGKKKKDFTVFKLKSKRNFEPDRKVQLVSCTTFLCNNPPLIKTPSTSTTSRFFHHTQEEVMSTFISFDTCAIQADATPNSKACQFPTFILSTLQHTKYQNQSPECDSCHLQMKHGAVCVSLHHIQGTQQPPKVSPPTMIL
jgi:hypothetical protein